MECFFWVVWQILDAYFNKKKCIKKKKVVGGASSKLFVFGPSAFLFFLGYKNEQIFERWVCCLFVFVGCCVPSGKKNKNNYFSTRTFSTVKDEETSSKPTNTKCKILILEAKKVLSFFFFRKTSKKKSKKKKA